MTDTAQGKRRITVRAAVSLGVGSIVGAGIFALMGVAATEAGSAVWLSFLGAGIIALLTGHSFAQLERIWFLLCRIKISVWYEVVLPIDIDAFISISIHLTVIRS